MTRRRATRGAPVSVWSVLYRAACDSRCPGCGPNADCTYIMRFTHVDTAWRFARQCGAPDARVSEDVVSRDLARRWGLA